MSELSEHLKQKVQDDLNEIPEFVEEQIRSIQSWVDTQEHLNVRKDERWILNFLRYAKFNIEQTKKQLDFFYTMRTLLPEFFSNRDPMLPEIQDILERGMVVPLLNPTDPTGPCYTLYRWKKGDPSSNSFTNFVKVLLMTADILLNENDNYTVVGLIATQDFNDYPFDYILQKTPVVCKKAIVALQDTYPVRIQALNLINVPPFIETVYSLFKGFLNDDFRKKVKFYGLDEMKDLHKDIPLEVLPKQYGGDGGCIDEMAANWKMKMESYREWFLEDAQYCSDESKRAGKPKTAADLFGVEEALQKLEID